MTFWSVDLDGRIVRSSRVEIVQNCMVAPVGSGRDAVISVTRARSPQLAYSVRLPLSYSLQYPK